MPSNSNYTLNPVNGSFRTIEALNGYFGQLLNQTSNSTTVNNSQGATVIVQGTNNVLSGDILSFSSTVKLVGDNGALNFLGSTTLNNVELDNLSITVSAACGLFDTTFNNCQITVSSSTGFIFTSNCSFNNCTINYTYDATSDSNFTVGQLGNFLNGCLFGSVNTSTPSLENISIQNCSFTTPNANYFPFVSILVGTESGYLQNIQIKNNTFTNTGSTKDQRGVIGIVSNVLTTPTLTSGLRAVNISIENNICNEQQLIAFTATLDGSNKINNMLVPANVSISKNTCGAICYLAKQGVVTQAITTTQNNTTESSLFITQNYCKLIYCGFSNGYINFGSANRAVNNITSSVGLYSASTYITKNVCSWIQVGLKSPIAYTAPIPILQICNNRLTSYPITFSDTSNFFANYYNSTTAVNTGIIIDGISGEINNGVLVDGNAIDQGVYGSGSTISNYVGRMVVSLPATIVNNVFQSPNSSTPEYMLQIIGANSCKITNNTFVRGSSTILYYIFNSGTAANQLITNNSFDNSTVDGTSDVIVSGIASTSTYEQNKNQIIYVNVPFLNSSYGTTLEAQTSYMETIVNSSSIFIGVQAGTTSPQSINARADVSASMPVNTRILDCKIGLWTQGGYTMNSTGNVLDLAITDENVVIANYPAGLNSTLDVYNKDVLANINLINVIAIPEYNLFTNFAAITSITQYISLTNTKPDFFINTKNNKIVADLQVNISLATTAVLLEMWISPLVLRCIW